MPDAWSPGAYGRFRDARLRPALDLLAQVPEALPEGAIVDLGCGSGSVGAALRDRFPARHLAGVDGSAAMLAAARETGAYDALEERDIAAWCPDRPVALVFSNAALNWVPSHRALLPRLAAALMAGGVLAVQMPDQADAPSHALWRETAGAWLSDARIAALCPPAILRPAAYLDLLGPLGAVELWETTYHLLLPAVPGRHPVRAFTEATYAQPLLREAGPRLAEAYEARLAAAYPVEAGHVRFPFRRLFLTLTV